MQAIVRPLLEWFQNHRRPLPWRQDTNPYHVWVSEIMLQQTRIEAVIRYYTRFMTALPDIPSLSKIADDALLKLWEGLGYYSRAHNLKKAAQTIMRDYGGFFPDTFSEIKKLSGIGEYTAGAIASICFQEKVPAIDGNVLRVIARVTGNHDNVLLPAVKKHITSQLTAIIPDQAGDFNEALMELGELVCLPNGTPLCAICPLQQHCTAYREGLTTELPVRIKELKRTHAKWTVMVLITSDDRIAIEKRGVKGLLAGMYQLPNTEKYHSPSRIKEQLAAWNLTPRNIALLGEAKHAFTHIDWTMKGWKITVESPNDAFLWVSKEELQTEYALPTAFRKILRLL